MKKPKRKSAPSARKDLEAKFAETAFQLNQERNDFLLPQILDFVANRKWINLRPEYQRRLVWDAKKRSRFIESLLLNIPIPQLFLYEWELGRYEVMDGQQRINSIVEFYDNGYALKGLERWKELNGLRYRELPETLRRGLDRRRLSATVLLVGGSQADSQLEQQRRGDIRKLVFERLNTGGQHLNPQELRNCLYAGPFNDMLIRLARSRAFAEIWGIPVYEDNVDKDGRIAPELAGNRYYRRMIDCEIVLRYFAFSKRSRIKGSVRSILDKCMEDHLKASDAETEDYEAEFSALLGLAQRIFGVRTFRHRTEGRALKLSIPLYDAVMVGLKRLQKDQKTLVAKRRAIVSALDKLLDEKEAYDVVVGRPNTAGAIVDRINLVHDTIRNAAGL